MTPKICVYTCLIGNYESLNEQEIKKNSSIPFYCLTDNATLKSNTWEVIHVDPILPADPIRSQRWLKMMPHLIFQDYDISLYIDNSVLLSRDPAEIIKDYLEDAIFALPMHSYRDSLLDEFLEVAKIGYDDQSRIFEQLNHYHLTDSAILDEKPYWTAIMIRHHHNPKLIKVMETWITNVFRYSRRDQLSINLAMKQNNFTPKVWKIDNYISDFHKWPVLHNRQTNTLFRNPMFSQMPAAVCLRQLEKKLEHSNKKLQEMEELLSKVSKRWRVTTPLRAIIKILRKLK